MATPQQEAGSLIGPRALALAWLMGYLALSIGLLASSHPEGNAPAIVLHVTLLVFVGWTLVGRGRVAAVAGDLAPLAIAPALYGAIPRLIAAAGSTFHDATVQGWEQGLFGAQPSRMLAHALPYGVLSEVLHAGYLAYYPLIFVPPLLLYARRARAAYHETVLALVITFLLCWTIFVFWPVEGPRYLWSAPSGVPHGYFRRVAVSLLDGASSRGAAFPSSHMAVAVVQAVQAWRWQSQGGAAVVTTIAALIGLGAVYGGFHYGIDMIVGAMLGIAISTSSPGARRDVTR